MSRELAPEEIAALSPFARKQYMVYLARQRPGLSKRIEQRGGSIGVENGRQMQMAAMYRLGGSLRQLARLFGVGSASIRQGVHKWLTPEQCARPQGTWKPLLSDEQVTLYFNQLADIGVMPDAETLAQVIKMKADANGAATEAESEVQVSKSGHLRSIPEAEPGQQAEYAKLNLPGLDQFKPKDVVETPDALAT